MRLLIDASPSSLFTSVTSHLPSSFCTRTARNSVFSLSVDQFEASLSVLQNRNKAMDQQPSEGYNCLLYARASKAKGGWKRTQNPQPHSSMSTNITPYWQYGTPKRKTRSPILSIRSIAVIEWFQTTWKILLSFLSMMVLGSALDTLTWRPRLTKWKTAHLAEVRSTQRGHRMQYWAKRSSNE